MDVLARLSCRAMGRCRPCRTRLLVLKLLLQSSFPRRTGTADVIQKQTQDRGES